MRLEVRCRSAKGEHRLRALLATLPLILILGTNCSGERSGGRIAPGVTLRCASNADPEKPFFATVGSVEKAEGRAVALVTINDQYSPNYRGRSFMAVDRAALARSCTETAASHPLSPDFQPSADEWRGELKRGEADAFVITLQQSYEPFRLSDPPPGYAGPPLEIGHKFWATRPCMPGRTTEGQADCVSHLKRPLVDRLFRP